MASRWSELVVDSLDPHAQARFWAAVLDWEVRPDGDEAEVAPPGGEGTTLFFAKVPEGKTVKNRLHIDLRPDDRDAEVERLLALGARHAEVGQRGDETWVVLADPEGNELCVLQATPPGD